MIPFCRCCSLYIFSEPTCMDRKDEKGPSVTARYPSGVKLRKDGLPVLPKGFGHPTLRPIGPMQSPNQSEEQQDGLGLTDSEPTLLTTNSSPAPLARQTEWSSEGTHASTQDSQQGLFNQVVLRPTPISTPPTASIGARSQSLSMGLQPSPLPFTSVSSQAQAQARSHQERATKERHAM